MFESITLYLGAGIGVNLIFDLLNDVLPQEFYIKATGKLVIALLWPVFIFIFVIALIVNLLK